MSLLSGARVERREQQFIRGIFNNAEPSPPQAAGNALAIAVNNPHIQ